MARTAAFEEVLLKPTEARRYIVDIAAPALRGELRAPDLVRAGGDLRRRQLGDWHTNHAYAQARRFVGGWLWSWCRGIGTASAFAEGRILTRCH